MYLNTIHLIFFKKVFKYKILKILKKYGHGYHGFNKNIKKKI